MALGTPRPRCPTPRSPPAPQRTPLRGRGRKGGGGEGALDTASGGEEQEKGLIDGRHGAVYTRAVSAAGLNGGCVLRAGLAPLSGCPPPKTQRAGGRRCRRPGFPGPVPTLWPGPGGPPAPGGAVDEPSHGLSSRPTPCPAGTGLHPVLRRSWHRAAPCPWGPVTLPGSPQQPPALAPVPTSSPRRLAGWDGRGASSTVPGAQRAAAPRHSVSRGLLLKDGLAPAAPEGFNSAAADFTTQQSPCGLCAWGRLGGCPSRNPLLRSPLHQHPGAQIPSAACSTSRGRSFGYSQG